MYAYNINQWVLFFYLYSLLGWVWESSYVSIKSMKLVNRGFLHGPFLPLYGSGAIVILFVTMPIRNNIMLVFLLGMISATILEYFTGYVMEKLFHVRYWDYTNELFNINGYICLKCTLVWGIFSVLMIKIIHPPIESFLFMIPEHITIILLTFITIGIIIDLVISFCEAMNLKEVLSNVTENNSSISKLQKRLEVLCAFIEEDRRELKVKLNKNNNDIRNMVLEKLNFYEQMLDDKFEKQDEKKQKYKCEINDLKENIKSHRIRLHSVKDRKINRSIHILKRNPGTITKKYSDALDEMKKLYKDKK